MIQILGHSARVSIFLSSLSYFMCCQACVDLQIVGGSSWYLVMSILHVLITSWWATNTWAVLTSIRMWYGHYFCTLMDACAVCIYIMASIQQRFCRLRVKRSMSAERSRVRNAAAVEKKAAELQEARKRTRVAEHRQEVGLTRAEDVRRIYIYFFVYVFLFHVSTAGAFLT